MNVIKRLLFLLLLGLAGTYVVRTYVCEAIYIASASMSPTLETGTRIFVNKFVYLFNKPKRGEVVVFKRYGDDNKEYIKRVIGIAGDVVQMKEKNVYLNDVLLVEPYVKHIAADVLFDGDNTPPISIPDGFVFLLGDNRDVSGDSRDWHNSEGAWIPYIPLSYIYGRVLKAPQT